MAEFIFKNFEPEDYLEQYARAMLERVKEAAPYDATESALISKEQDRYRVRIELKSSSGPFIAVASSTDCREALDRAEAQIHRQLLEWKNNRFVSLLLTPEAELIEEHRDKAKKSG